MAAFSYDPKNVIIVYGGVPISGYADGSFVKVEPNDDDFKLKVGADGEGCRVRSRDKSAKITVTLLQSSLSNAVLSAARRLDIETPVGLVGKILEVFCVGGSRFTAVNAWIMRMPDADFSKDVGERTWVFETDDLDAVFAGELPLL